MQPNDFYQFILDAEEFKRGWDSTHRLKHRVWRQRHDNIVVTILSNPGVDNQEFSMRIVIGSNRLVMSIPRRRGGLYTTDRPNDSVMVECRMRLTRSDE